MIMHPDVRIYRRYTKWLEELPVATEVGEQRSVMLIQPVYKIEGHRGRFIIGATGNETPQAVIATLPQGNLLKARVFEPT